VSAKSTDLRADQADDGEGTDTRRRILRIALSLMSQRGVDGTSMRDLASAAELNVASLYHYFPSKRDLLESVLAEEGFMPASVGELDMEDGTAPLEAADDPATSAATLAQVLADILDSMFTVEDFVRLMVGEAIRGDTTARAVGYDLFTTFETAIAEWISTNRPDLDKRSGAPEVSRLLCAMVVGLFIQHAAGVLSDQDLKALARQRADEAAQIIESGS
jgi:AcrR family transcriptional regulator